MTSLLHDETRLVCGSDFDLSGSDFAAAPDRCFPTNAPIILSVSTIVNVFPRINWLSYNNLSIVMVENRLFVGCSELVGCRERKPTHVDD